MNKALYAFLILFCLAGPQAMAQVGGVPQSSKVNIYQNKQEEPPQPAEFGEGQETNAIALSYFYVGEIAVPSTVKRIYVDKPSHYLVGNPCITYYTMNQMGFVYVGKYEFNPESFDPKAAGNPFWNNLGVKLGLLFKKGPFWKTKVNRQLETCRRGSVVDN